MSTNTDSTTLNYLRLMHTKANSTQRTTVKKKGQTVSSVLRHVDYSNIFYARVIADVCGCGNRHM